MTRLADAWRTLQREQRLAALAALGLFVSMFLPWYSKTVTGVEHGVAKAAQTSLTAFQAFSFVEAAVLLVSAGVLAMLFARAERRSFQLPGGDGLIVMIAGGWTAVLIFYRLLDKPGLHGNQRFTATEGVQWGIFIALLVALGLLYSGGRMRAAARSRGASASGHARATRTDPYAHAQAGDSANADEEERQERTTTVRQPRPGPQTAASALADRPAGAPRPRYPPAPRPAPSEQMSLDDPPAEGS
jgi:hypothetical protein